MNDTPVGEPTVSIIVPAYNTADFIGETLDSVLAQSFSDYEVIVVNDGSPDTEQLECVLEPYRDSIVYIKQENRGPSGARNTGLRAARGKYIAFLDGDDIWHPDYLLRQLAVLERDPSLCAVFPNVVTFGGTTEDGRAMMDSAPLEGEITFERLLAGDCYVFVGVTARRDALLEVGMFDESLRRAEDYDLWLRLLFAGRRIGYHREVLARYRKRPGSQSADPRWMLQTLLEVLDKVGRTLALSPSQRELLARQVVRVRAELRLAEGKHAFFRRDTAGAIANISEANRYFRSRKLSAATRLIRAAPGLLLWAYRLRDRFYFGASTEI